MKHYFSSRYQRHKRILRILSLQDGYDSYRPRRPSSEHFIFPRYTWARFFLTFGLMMILSIPSAFVLRVVFSVLSPKVQIMLMIPVVMLIGFLAVEIVDDYFLRWEEAFQEFRRTVLPFIVLALVVLIYFVIKNPAEIKRSVSDWQESVNENVQSKPQPIVASPNQGLNWRLLFESPNYLKKTTRNESEIYCRSLGADWQVFDGDKMFIAHPNPSFDRSFYVWHGLTGAVLDKYGIQPPKVFVTSAVGTRFSTLCINKRIRP